jgi:opacity protein-like surface antigen
MTKQGLLTIFLSFLVCHGIESRTAVDGLRLGIQAGYAATDSRVIISRTSSPAWDRSDVSGRGFMGGATISWDSFLGESFVLAGIEASANFASTKGQKSIRGTFPLAPATSDLSTKTNLWQHYDLSVKFGYLLKEAALPYCKAGATWGRWKASSFSQSLPASGSSVSSRIGFLGGIGVEFPTDALFSWGFEYTYRTYTNFSHQLKDNDTGESILDVKVAPTTSTFMLQVKYKIW